MFLPLKIWPEGSEYIIALFCNAHTLKDTRTHAHAHTRKQVHTNKHTHTPQVQQESDGWMRPKASMLATSRMPHSLLLLGGWGGTRKRAVIRQAQGHIKSIFKVYSLCDENTCEELERTRELLLSRRKDALQVYSKGYSYAPTFFIFTFYTTGRCDLGGPCHVTIL